MIIDPAHCTYCLGDVAFNESTLRWEHMTDGERITGITSGDFVSAAHNRAGTPVNVADVEFIVDDENLSEPITDVAGYLSCVAYP